MGVLYLYQCSARGCEGEVLVETEDYHLNHVCPICEHDLLPPTKIDGRNIILRKTEKDICNSVK